MAWNVPHGKVIVRCITLETPWNNFTESYSCILPISSLRCMVIGRVLLMHNLVEGYFKVYPKCSLRDMAILINDHCLRVTLWKVVLWYMGDCIAVLYGCNLHSNWFQPVFQYLAVKDLILYAGFSGFVTILYMKTFEYNYNNSIHKV